MSITYTEDKNRPPPVIKRVNLGKPRPFWPQRNLALPMSPTGNPSSLDIDDTRPARGVHSRPFYGYPPTMAPREKPPRYTALDSFRHTQNKKPHQLKNSDIPNQSLGSASLWRESVLPVGLKDPQRPALTGVANTTSTRNDDSLLLTESVVPDNKFWKDNNHQKHVSVHANGSLWQANNGVDGFRVHRPSVTGRGERRKNNNAAEKSYDREVRPGISAYAYCILHLA